MIVKNNPKKIHRARKTKINPRRIPLNNKTLKKPIHNKMKRKRNNRIANRLKKIRRKIQKKPRKIKKKSRKILEKPRKKTKIVNLIKLSQKSPKKINNRIINSLMKAKSQMRIMR